MSDELSLETISKLQDLVQRADSFSSDSRTATSTTVFVALKGVRSDGHLFVDELVKTGRCLAAVVSEEFFSQASEELRLNCFPVENTHLAHRELARLFRGKFQVPLVAIGGSAGKTSTKEFLKALCASSFQLVATQGSQNGNQGIPKTLEGLNAETELAIIEVGIDRVGDMQEHAALLKPDYAVLTSIGEEHLENLKDLPTVFEEESKLFDVTLKYGGRCFAPLSDIWLQRYEGKFTGTPSKGRELEPPLKSYFHGVLEQNLCLAVEVAKSIGVPSEKISEIVLGLEPPEGRGKIVRSTSEVVQTFVLDHYNSNPASLKAAFLELNRMLDEERQNLHLILGEMRELGVDSESFHRDALKLAQNLKPKTLILIGEEFERVADCLNDSSIKCFREVEQATLACKSLTNQPGLFLFKGSRGVQLEKLFTSFPPLA